MNSFNHYSFGSVGNWLLTHSLGIVTDKKGSLCIAPEIDRSGKLTYASGWLKIPEGKVESSWRITGDEVVYDLSVPANVDAVLKTSSKTYKLNEGKNIIRETL